jgi:hypothetical protein
VREGVCAGGSFARACLCGGSCCTHQNSHSSRTTNHLHLPHAQDYDGHADRVKDYLRGCLVCDSLAEVVTLYELLKAMADEGLIKVVQIKNRYRDGSTSSGYADLNINLLYEGHVCEIQVRDPPPPLPCNQASYATDIGSTHT